LREAEAEEMAATVAAEAGSDEAQLHQMQVSGGSCCAAAADSVDVNDLSCLRIVSQVIIAENVRLQRRLLDDRDAAAAATAAAAADHCLEATVLRREIADLRLSLSAAAAADGIVAALTDDNTVLADAALALKGRVTELEELVDMSRM